MLRKVQAVFLILGNLTKAKGLANNLSIEDLRTFCFTIALEKDRWIESKPTGKRLGKSPQSKKPIFELERVARFGYSVCCGSKVGPANFSYHGPVSVIKELMRSS